jgi:hypothetical protein
MKYIDKLIEATADWFMDFFLDPAYVVEKFNGRVEAVSVSAVTFAPEITTIEPVVNNSFENEEKVSIALSFLKPFIIAVVMQIKVSTATFINHINGNEVREKADGFGIPQMLLPLRFSKYLTG